MRLFPKLLLLLSGLSVLPLLLSSGVLLWRTDRLHQSVLEQIQAAGGESATVGQEALTREAQTRLEDLVERKALEIEAAFESVRRAVQLQAGLAGRALQEAPPPSPRPLYRAAEAAAWAKSGGRFAREERGVKPYAIYHLAPGVSPEAAQPVLQRLSRLADPFAYNQRVLSPMLRSSFVGHESGALVGYPGGDAFPAGYDHRKRAWYDSSKELKRFIATRMYQDKNARDLVMSFAHPVYGPDKAIVGVSGMDVQMTALFERLFKLEGLPVADALVFDAKGDVRVSASFGKDGKMNFGQVGPFYRPHVDSFAGGKFKPIHAAARQDSERASGLLLLGPDGRPASDPRAPGTVLCAWARFTIHFMDSVRPIRHWYYAAVVPAAAVLRPAGEVHRALSGIHEKLSAALYGESRRLRARAAALAGLALLLALAAAWLSARSAARPLERMTAAVDLIRQGDFDQEVEAKGRDEIGALGAAINEMAKDLRQGLFLKATFKRYVDPSVVEQILKNPGQARLGGERRVMTAFFLDLAGFSTFAEDMAPEKLVEFVNEALGAVTEVLLAEEGLVDKYEGDAVVAFWGAPGGAADHAARACRAALSSLKALETLAASWKERGLPPLTARVGLSTGPMIVGNIGSAVKMNYTVMGDAVNLGSRLEGANKAYGTRVLMSRMTRETAGAAVCARELDLLAVKGRHHAERVYELAGLAGDVPAARLAAFGLFERALAAYRKRDWDKAAELFARADTELGGDPPSRVFLDRVASLRAAPPPADWDGVFRLATK